MIKRYNSRFFSAVSLITLSLSAFSCSLQDNENQQSVILTDVVIDSMNQYRGGDVNWHRRGVKVFIEDSETPINFSYVRWDPRITKGDTLNELVYSRSAPNLISPNGRLEGLRVTR
jgi:hypothetical protein